jgi:transcriptional regulator with XRE-family HTH domain
MPRRHPDIYPVMRTLDQHRQRQGVTRAELARRVGCHPATLTPLFTDPSNPTFATLARIADALGRRLEVRFPLK